MHFILITMIERPLTSRFIMVFLESVRASQVGLYGEMAADDRRLSSQREWIGKLCRRTSENSDFEVDQCCNDVDSSTLLCCCAVQSPCQIMD